MNPVGFVVKENGIELIFGFKKSGIRQDVAHTYMLLYVIY